VTAVIAGLGPIVARTALALQDAHATPEAAVRRFVEAGGMVYVGDCAATRSPEDRGKVCSWFVAERGVTRAYLTGRTFSEYRQWVFVRRLDTGWVIAGDAPLDFFHVEVQIPWPD
jgi:hypothetical protein